MKDYREWHEKKTKINNAFKRPFFHEREIWFCHLGANVGYEEDGRGENFFRPIIVFRKFNNEVFWAIPLTRTDRKNKFYYEFDFGKNNKSIAILSQIRLIDAKRLSYRIGNISTEDFKELIKKLKDLFPQA